jgi:hypothetical protein
VKGNGTTGENRNEWVGGATNRKENVSIGRQRPFYIIRSFWGVFHLLGSWAGTVVAERSVAK